MMFYAKIVFFLSVLIPFFSCENGDEFPLVQQPTDQPTSKENNFKKADENNNPAEKKEYYKLVASGTQLGCEGAVDAEVCERYVEKLNTCVEGVCFKSKGNVCTISGGTCSAKAIHFVKDLLSNTDTNPASYYLKEKQYFRAATAEDRNVQAAYNQIYVSELQKDLEQAHESKINALIGLYNLQAVWNSNMFNLTIARSDAYERELEKLADGVYLVRAIKPDKSSKLEESGHSMGLVKDDGVYFLYEPNTGLHETNSARKIWEILHKQHTQFYLPELRIYKIAIIKVSKEN